ncbi:MAG TPA: DUF4349 domain-containing protein [Gaiellaceae bacterium]|jgi:hypothetical protein
MSQPDQESIVNEIRSARIAASPELRARVRAIAESAPAGRPSRPRRELPWRRLALVLVPACAAVGAAAALGVGLSGSGKGGPERSARAEVQRPAPLSADSKSAGSGTVGGAALPATSGRAQLYEAELTLKVADLSAVTKRALGLTRDFHGYVRSVEYGSGSERGSAYLVVRVPVGSVQEAIVRYSALGRILDQHVSIRDVQPQVDRRFRLLQAQRDAIAKLQARLESPSLTPAERIRLENRLVAARRQLVVLQKEQAALQRETAFATVSLDLRSQDKAVVVPHEPGRIGRALHRSGEILAEEAKVLVYVLVVGAPFFVLGAAAVGGLSVRRRRREERLLATS